MLKNEAKGKAINKRNAVSYDHLLKSDLVIDCIYEGGKSKRGKADEVLSRLLPGLSNSGGFRAAGGSDSPRVVVLYSTGSHPDWPDNLDVYRGTYTYYGDNRTPGRDLHDTPRGGNKVLRNAFALAHSDESARASIPIFLLFEKAESGHDVRFRGLAVPGGKDLLASEDLVAIWRVDNNVRFQNYRATFSILDTGSIDGDWIRELVAGASLDIRDVRVPAAVTDWVKHGTYRPLIAPRVRQGRTVENQTPQTSLGKDLISEIRNFCKDDDFLFEAVAVEIWLMTCSEPVEMELTRRSRDGGRDAIGRLYLGPRQDRIAVEFALEAKHYAPSNAVGVKDVSRLISRIKNREFGVLVTTSYLASQAYQEIREDGHPIVVIAGADIVQVLNSNGINTLERCRTWLETVIDPRIIS